MKFPDQYRAQHPLGFAHEAGDPFGFFMVPYNNRYFRVLADDLTEWGHVSISLRDRCPSWDEMCYIKNLFFEEDQCVVQFHPAKKDYVNIAKYCLHLWHYKKGFPTPPKENV